MFDFNELDNGTIATVDAGNGRSYGTQLVVFVAAIDFVSGEPE